MEYKNKTNKDLTLPSIGIVKAGGTVETEIKINNPNFEVVVKKPIPSEAEKKEEKKVETINK